MLDILEISDLSLHLTQTGRPLLEHFSFTLGAGDRAVLIGEEGNGKSTLLRYLAQPEALKGYCEAEGRVALRGRPGYLPQLLPEALRECTPADYLAEIPAHRASELLERLGLPQELFTPLFAIARMPGWCAHRMEELSEGGKIIRPACKCIERRRPYVPMENR